VSDVKNHLLLEPKFLIILTDFGQSLLQNFHLKKEIKDFSVDKKIWRILKEYWQKFGKDATYERICMILDKEFNLCKLAGNV